MAEDYDLQFVRVNVTGISDPLGAAVAQDLPFFTPVLNFKEIGTVLL